MGTRTTLVTAVVVGIAVASLSACSSAGDLRIWNGGPDDVTVLTGDEVVEVSADGGVVLLNYGCTPGDVTVQFASGSSTVLSGPVCPDQRIVITDEGAELRPLPPSETGRSTGRTTMAP